MGFRVYIQADYGNEVLRNIHPEGKSSGGKAILSFLGGLQIYCDWDADFETSHPELKSVADWYRALEQATGITLCMACQVVLDCQWADGGDSTMYHEDDYEFYLKRNPAAADTTSREDFVRRVRLSQERWSPTDRVLEGVRLILDALHKAEAESLVGFYEGADTISDFEALAANLNLLVERGSQVVRLNFN